MSYTQTIPEEAQRELNELYLDFAQIIGTFRAGRYFGIGTTGFDKRFSDIASRRLFKIIRRYSK